MERKFVGSADGGKKVEKRSSWKAKEKKYISWPFAFVIITSMICITIMTMWYSMPDSFDVNFASDDNVVEISDNFKEMADSQATAQINLQVCETKLSYYENLGLDNPWVNT